MQIKITKNVTYQDIKMLKIKNNLSPNIIYSILEGLIKMLLVKIRVLVFEKSKFD